MLAFAQIVSGILLFSLFSISVWTSWRDGDQHSRMLQQCYGPPYE